MFFAGITDTGYKIVAFIHVVVMFAAVAPVFVYPLLARTAGVSNSSLHQAMLSVGRRIYAPALVVGGFLGFALLGMSDKAYETTDAWVLISIVLWIAINGVMHAMLFPAERAIAAGDQSAARRADTANALIAVMVVAVLFLMSVKPGA
jgi:uncharacterized membrane protein